MRRGRKGVSEHMAGTPLGSPWPGVVSGWELGARPLLLARSIQGLIRGAGAGASTQSARGGCWWETHPCTEARGRHPVHALPASSG